jgi:hypothetical protein
MHVKGTLGVVAMEKKECRGVKLYEWFQVRLPTILDCHPIDALRMVETAGFEIFETREKEMWGLPIKIISARKNG